MCSLPAWYVGCIIDRNKYVQYIVYVCVRVCVHVVCACVCFKRDLERMSCDALSTFFAPTDLFTIEHQNLFFQAQLLSFASRPAAYKPSENMQSVGSKHPMHFKMNGRHVQRIARHFGPHKRHKFVIFFWFLAHSCVPQHSSWFKNYATNRFLSQQDELLHSTLMEILGLCFFVIS